MRVHRYVLPVVLIAVLLGSTLIGKAIGYWSTSGKTAVMVDETGAADPEGIKGWMTLAQIVETYGIPEDELRTRLNLPSSVPADTALKDLEALVTGFETSAVRDAVTAYRAENSGSAPLVSEITPPAKPAGEVEATPPPAPSGEAQPTPAGGLPSTAEIKGKNTLADVAGMYGIPVERIIAEAGLPADVDTKATLQTIASKHGIEVLNIREAVDRILAAK